MKKLNRKWLIILCEVILVILAVVLFAFVIIGSVLHFSDYHLTTFQVTIICGIFGIMLGYLFTNFREIKIKSEIEDKQLDSINKDMSRLVEHFNSARQRNHNS